MDEDDVTIESEGREGSSSEEDIDAMESRVGAKAEKLKKELEQAKQEKQEYLDGWQRAKADYVNALKRFEDEKQAATAYGIEKAAKAFIPAIDSLERAKEAGELPPGWSGIVKQLEEGITSLGLERVGTEGEQFDPSLHEALGMDATNDAASDDTVSAVLEQGWKRDGRVIRPAKVRVYHRGA
jgi:molecular chaperone GrpE